MFCANRSPVSFSRKETAASTTAAAHVERGVEATALVTTGVTKAELNCNTDADDGAAAQGMDCT
jgi:hypothetical protein